MLLQGTDRKRPREAITQACRYHPPVLRSDYTAPEPPTAPPVGLINGLFADGAELWEYQSGLFEPFELEYYEDGYPKLPACLRRTA
jgi:hypothetical protein